MPYQPPEEVTTVRDDDEQKPTGKWPFISTLLALLLFPIFMCGWKFGVDIVASVISIAIEVNRLGELNLENPTTLLRPDILGVAFYVSMGGLVLGAWGTSALLKWRTSDSFAFYTAHKRSRFIAILSFSSLAGFVVGTFPGWMAQKLGELFPSLMNQGSLELVQKMLIDGPIWGRIISISAVCIGAPILEELVFRGFLWALIERTVNAFRDRYSAVSPTEGLSTASWVAFIATSLGFALFHMDPIQSTALIFTAFILGWLRLVSRSIWPCIALHFVNNTLATVIAISTSDWESEVSVGLGLAILCGSTTLLLAGLCWPFRSWKALIGSQS